MKKILLLLIYVQIFMSCSVLRTEIHDVELESTPSIQPLWVKHEIEKKEGFIFATGNSQARITVEDAKEDALIEATNKIVQYSGVTVEAFSRSIEASSVREGKEYYNSDFEAKSKISAKAFIKIATPLEWYIQKIARMKGKRKISEYYLASVYLKVPENEIERIKEEKDIKLSLDIGLYYEGEDNKLLYLTEGTVLHSGSAYALYVKPNDNCYLYIFQVDDLGNSYCLFPSKKFNTGDNLVKAGIDIWIPNTEQYFILDETIGKESVYIFASFASIPELEGTTEIKLADMDRVLKSMGVVGVKDKMNTYQVEPPQKSIHVAEVKKKLQAEGAFVYETWFWHR